MKFFTLLGFKYGNYWRGGNIYGPYEDDEAVEKEIARLWPNDKTKQFLVFDGQIVRVKLSPEEKPESEKRKPGNTENYVESDDGWKCKDCGADIVGVRVARPIWIRGTVTGSGECHYEIAPYCPNCETRPNSRGFPVYSD